VARNSQRDRAGNFAGLAHAEPRYGVVLHRVLARRRSSCLSNSVQATLAPARNLDEIERIITVLGREPGGGLIVLPSAPITVHVQRIIELTALNRLAAIYPFDSYARGGGLVAYGVDLDDIFRRAASYVDRILKGEKPADLPVQTPVKFRLVAADAARPRRRGDRVTRTRGADTHHRCRVTEVKRTLCKHTDDRRCLSISAIGG
jgi:hypothetical protein